MGSIVVVAPLKMCFNVRLKFRFSPRVCCAGVLIHSPPLVRVQSDISVHWRSPVWKWKLCTSQDMSVYASSGERQSRFRLTRTQTGQSSIADAMPI